MSKQVNGFSKLDKEGKIKWLIANYFNNDHAFERTLKRYWNSDAQLQQLHDEFIENTISNYYLPFAVAPNFLINGELYAVPMAIEESSVVAAASKAAKFWLERGGFKAEVISATKIGHVHFLYEGTHQTLHNFFTKVHHSLLEATSDITESMRKRGGGIKSIALIDKTKDLDNYFQIAVKFETKDAMGANFINSCLEKIAATLLDLADAELEGNLQVVMSILSNYVPECIVRAEVSCAIEDLGNINGIDAEVFAHKFKQAVNIAEIEPYRAVTHNKGIMNGIDAVVLATGNDFRAVEAGVHAYASKNGRYSSLTHAKITNDDFKFWIEVPLALGTVGGLTKLHPMVKLALQMLQNPNAEELMKITAVAGLAQNFAALKSLTTTGIQQGHMKMHLMNILNQLGANSDEKNTIAKKFEKQTVSHSAVTQELENLRSN